MNSLFSGAFADPPSVLERLIAESLESWREFRTDPAQFVLCAFRTDAPRSRHRRVLLNLGLGIGLMIYATFFAMILLMWSMRSSVSTASDRDLDHPGFLSGLVFTPKKPTVSDNKHTKGGGGGGDEAPTPPSNGELPRFSLNQLTVAPTTVPQLEAPSLPVSERVLADPALQPKRDELAPTGLPNSVDGPPSDGPGTRDGIGFGTRGGVGPGAGLGAGPGEEGGAGGGRHSRGGTWVRGGAPTSADSLPVLLHRVRPNYTEEARRNKAQGVVRARILVGANGAVERVLLLSRLPYGLDEEAVRVAHQLRFRPAAKNGVPVALWIALEIEFNLR